MKLSTVQKLGGVAVCLGAVLLAAYAVLFSLLFPLGTIRQDMTTAILDPNWLWVSATAFAGVLLMMFGLMAVYSRMYASSGAAGLLGFLFVEIAYLLQGCKVTWEICLYPLIASHQVFALLLRDHILQQYQLVMLFKSTASMTILLGILLLCWALLRSKEFPKSAAVLIFAGALTYALGPRVPVWATLLGICVHSVGFLLLGLRLLRTTEQAAPQAVQGGGVKAQLG